MGRRTMNATDLGISLDMIAARKAPREWIFEEGCRPFERLRSDRIRSGFDPCPVCGGKVDPSTRRETERGAVEFDTLRYCLECDRAGMDDTPGIYPGLGVNAVLNIEYIESIDEVKEVRESPKYRPEPGLKGGVGISRARQRTRK